MDEKIYALLDSRDADNIRLAKLVLKKSGLTTKQIKSYLREYIMEKINRAINNPVWEISDRFFSYKLIYNITRDNGIDRIYFSVRFEVNSCDDMKYYYCYYEVSDAAEEETNFGGNSASCNNNEDRIIAIKDIMNYINDFINKSSDLIFKI